MATFHENLVQSFTNFKNKFLKANGKEFHFAYDSTTQKYGYTIDGTFHPFRKVQASKTVTAGTSAITVTPDSDNDGIASVTVNPTPSQSKSVTADVVAMTVTPDSGNLLSGVTVNPTPYVGTHNCIGNLIEGSTWGCKLEQNYGCTIEGYTFKTPSSYDGNDWGGIVISNQYGTRISVLFEVVALGSDSAVIQSGAGDSSLTLPTAVTTGANRYMYRDNLSMIVSIPANGRAYIAAKNCRIVGCHWFPIEQDQTNAYTMGTVGTLDLGSSNNYRRITADPWISTSILTPKYFYGLSDGIYKIEYSRLRYFHNLASDTSNVQSGFYNLVNNEPLIIEMYGTYYSSYGDYRVKVRLTPSITIAVDGSYNYAVLDITKIEAINTYSYGIYIYITAGYSGMYLKPTIINVPPNTTSWTTIKSDTIRVAKVGLSSDPRFNSSSEVPLVISSVLHYN